jgi:hypothetical protein
MQLPYRINGCETEGSMSKARRTANAKKETGIETVEDAGSCKALYLDTPAGKRESFERARRIGLWDAYYEGAPYENHREWRNLLNYSYDVEPPTIIVNYPRIVIDRPAHFAFDRIRGAVAADPSLQEFVASVVSANELLKLLREICVEASVKGDCLLVFDFDPTNPDNPFPIKLIGADDFAVECDPLDPSHARYFRIERSLLGSDGKKVAVREELHLDKLLCFKAEPARGRGIWGTGSALSLLGLAPDDALEWRVTSYKRNPFGFIPAVHLQNRKRSGRAYGESDLADLLTIFDDINWKLTQRSRNISRTMNAILKNVNGRILNEYVSEDAVLNVIGENAQVDYLVNDADMSEISTHLAELRRAVSEISGVTLLDPEKFTGFGAMSGFALSVLYEPLIAVAEQKRVVVGGAMERLLSMIARAAAKLGILESEPTSFDVKLTYGSMFRLSESELFDRQARLIGGMHEGIYTPEYVSQVLANE